MKPMQRRRAVQGAALLIALSALSAQASDYPNRPVRLIVASAPGGSGDVAARLLAQKMGETLGQPVVVENKAGAGMRIGAEFVARAPADGYTILLATSLTHGTVPALSRTLSYNPVTSFVPVAGLFDYASTIVCHPSVPATTVQELIDLAKKNPGQLTYSSAGIGTGVHLGGELFNSMAGVDMLHVPYKGAGPATQAVIANQISCTHEGLAKPFVDSGRVRAIATIGPRRDPRMPDVPTAEESGLKGFSMMWWQGLAVPAGTPPDVVTRLSNAARDALRDPEIQRRSYELGLNARYLSPADFKRQIDETLAQFKHIVATAKIAVE